MKCQVLSFTYFGNEEVDPEDKLCAHSEVFEPENVFNVKFK